MESRAKPGIEAMEREAMVRKKRIIEAGGREEKSPRKEEDSPGVKEVIVAMMHDDTAAAFHKIKDFLKEQEERKQKRDDMKSGGPGAPGPVIANQPNPPLANKMQKMPQQKVQTDATVWVENQILQTDAPGWSEISMEDMGDFDVAFRDGAIILSTPVATDCAGAPRPSKMPKDVDTQEEETPLRS